MQPRRGASPLRPLAPALTTPPFYTHKPPAQRSLEAITEELRVPGSKSLGPISRSVRQAQAAVTSGRDKIVADFAPAKRAEGEAALAKLEASLVEFNALIEAKDKQVRVCGDALISVHRVGCVWGARSIRSHARGWVVMDKQVGVWCGVVLCALPSYACGRGVEKW